MKHGLKRGYTLAEILIILALLGVVAAFAIPKVLQARGNHEATAKVKETIAMLEQAWSEHKTQNTFTVGAPLYDSLSGSFNDLSHDSGPASAVLGTGHPCADLEGYIQMISGVVVTGLSGVGAPSPNLRESVFPNTPPRPSNYLICIDTNGQSGPNEAGVDVFGGNFNQSGDFDGAGTQFTYAEDNENFYWGGKIASEVIYETSNPGAAAQPPFNAINARAGSLLY